MKNSKRISKSMALAAIIAVLMVAVTESVNAEVLPGKASVSPVDSVIYGRTYGEWAAAWHQWADSMPWDNHPLFETASCSQGQSGPVWFLGGRFCGTEQPECNNSEVVRSCTVPAGKSLFFPILNIACLDAEAKYGYCLDAGPNIVQMRAAIAGVIDQVTGLTVTVDGKPIKANLKKDFRVQSPVYPSLLPENNMYQAIAEPQIVSSQEIVDGQVVGSYLGVDDGIYVMLDPLKKGEHTLNFKGTFPQFDFSIDVTYHLTIE